MFFDPLNHKITVEEKLSLQKSLSSPNNQISFRQKTYLRKMNFNKRLKKKAIAFCQDCQKSNLGSFLVEEKNYLTVWIEVL